MTPVEASPLEVRQFDLTIRSHGLSPSEFKYRKFGTSAGVRVRVAGRGAATVSDSVSSEWLRDFAADLDRGLYGGQASALDALAPLLSAAESALVASGLPGILQFLNERVPHRFTALYRLDPGQVLTNVAVHDKHRHLDALDLRVVPLKDSFCQFVLRDGLFLTQSSGTDPRLVGHPYAGAVNCYVGVPVIAQNGMQGTLCHSDIEDHAVADREYLLLAACARLLSSYLKAGSL
jgi:GAF domain-containing protein